MFLTSRRRHTRLQGDWSSDVCSSDLSSNTAHRAGEMKTIGILTGGGDVPGLNPAIRAVTIRALREGYRVIGQIGRASCRERGTISVCATTVSRRDRSY